MKKLSYLIVLVLILGLVLAGCSLLSNVGQVPTNEQSSINYLTKGAGDEGSAEEFPLFAGQHIDVGIIKVWNDSDNLYVKYIVDDPWCLTETHLHVADSAEAIPQKNGNPIPGKFKYKRDHDPCVTDYTYTIEMSLIPGDEIYIAAHAVVKKEIITFDTCMIDFEEFSEYDGISSVATDCGEVLFRMVDYKPLMGLSVGDAATLTIKPDLPVIAEENTMGTNYYGLVAFTSNSGGMKDDFVLDDSGTGAGGKMLTDALDYSKTPLLYHAYTKYQAILVDVSDVLNVDTLNFVGIDLDHNELWHFQYFDENDVLIADVTVGPGTGAGDGKAYQTNFTDPRISKVAIWGEQNLAIPDRLGFAIDNFEVRTKTVIVQKETAWGAVSEGSVPFPGANWATYFTYTHDGCYILNITSVNNNTGYTHYFTIFYDPMNGFTGTGTGAGGDETLSSIVLEGNVISFRSDYDASSYYWLPSFVLEDNGTLTFVERVGDNVTSATGTWDITYDCNGD